MKKTLKKTLSLLLVITLLSSTLFSIKSFADNNDLTTYNENCATLYFSTLKENFGLNTEGTCAYVAAAMLLSYYDAYLDDRFIENRYIENGSITLTNDIVNVVSSPGIKKENSWRTNTSYSTYDEYINAFADQYLHLNLIKMGRDEENFYFLSALGNVLDYFGFDRLVDDNITPYINWSISVPETAELLTTYLSHRELDEYVTVRYLSYKDYRDIDTTLEEADAIIRQAVINKVNAGIPVLYGGFSEPEGILGQRYGHGLIAYDYDAENNELVFHSGWHDQDDRIIKEGDANFVYTEKLYMLWFDIESSALTHNNNCSEKYTLTEGNLQTDVCMCSLSIHPNHSHTFKTTTSGYTSSKHYYDCKWCDEVREESHSYSYVNYSSTQHKCLCTCGYTRLAAHLIRDTSAAVKRCIHCNAIVQSGGGAIVGLSLEQIQYITDNGSYVRPDGIIVVSDIDYELYLSGELDLDSLIYNTGCTH